MCTSYTAPLQDPCRMALSRIFSKLPCTSDCGHAVLCCAVLACSACRGRRSSLTPTPRRWT